MSLKREDYDLVMRVLSARREKALRESYERQEELYERLPAVFGFDEEIAKLLGTEAEARIRKNRALSDEAKKEREALTEKRNRLIVSAGFSEDFLAPRYTCEKCFDTGFTDGRKCSCLKKLESEVLMARSGIPAEKLAGGLSSVSCSIYENLEPLEELRPKRITQYKYMNSVVLPGLSAFLEDFENGRKGNILMFGPAGTGKTFLAEKLAGELMESGHSVVYERAGDMFELLSKAAFSKNDVPEAAGLNERLKESEVLILDDLGTEFMTELTKSKLFSLISDRLQRGLSTIITTNMSLSQIREVYSERLSSRLMGDYMVIPFYGRDLRLVKRG